MIANKCASSLALFTYFFILSMSMNNIISIVWIYYYYDYYYYDYIIIMIILLYYYYYNFDILQIPYFLWISSISSFKNFSNSLSSML